MTIEDIRSDIARAIREDPSEIGDDDSLIDLGLDSIRVMAIAQRWSDQGIVVRFAELAERPTLRGWWELVSQRQSAPAAES